MKKSLLFILALAILTPTIAKTKKKKSKQKEITSVQMHRTGCFGRCPDYTVDVNSDGTIVYTGIHFTKDSGRYEKNAGVAVTKKILDKFKKYRVDTCQDRYPNHIPDLPGLFYTIRYKNNSTKMIGNASFGPAFLKTLAADMDSVARVDKTWAKELMVKPQ